MLACLILAIYFQHRCTILLAEEEGGEMLSLLVAATVMILALVANLASTGKPIIQRKDNIIYRKAYLCLSEDTST
jgi:hypothetical protein